MTADNVQNKKPLFIIQTPEYTGCNPTSYEIYDETNNPHTILSLDQTNSNQIIVTCIDPSCILN